MMVQRGLQREAGSSERLRSLKHAAAGVGVVKTLIDLLPTAPRHKHGLNHPFRDSSTFFPIDRVAVANFQTDDPKIAHSAADCELDDLTVLKRPEEIMQTGACRNPHSIREQC